MRRIGLLLMAACSSGDVGGGIGETGACSELLAKLTNEATGTCTVSTVGATTSSGCASIATSSAEVGCASFDATTSTMTKVQLMGGDRGLLVELADPTRCEFRGCE